MRASPLLLVLAACSSVTSDDSSLSAYDTATDLTAESPCAALATPIAQVVCAADDFYASLDSSEQAAILYDFDDATAKTRWSNLPGVTRNGLALGSLDTDSLEAALTLMQFVLSADGYGDLVGVRAADDYLGEQSSGGGAYSSDNYYIAFIGSPSETGDWMLQLGGHHMAWNITFLAGAGYPTPAHLGVEPKASFTVNGESYAPLEDEGAALTALYGGLSSSELATAYLQGQSFADVVLGPVEYGTGSLGTVVYPSGTNRTGVLVSSLSAEQQALVTTAIRAWVADYDASIADSLVAAYTSADAYADTYVAWGGTESAGPDVDVSGTYMRIDGPRVWIEVACQTGVVIQGKTHFHTIYRDKSTDYGGSL